MENLGYEDVETIGLVIFAIFFVLWERLSPKNKNLDKKAHLKLDIAAFILIIVSINFSRFVVRHFYEFVNLPALNLMAATFTWPVVVKILLAHLVSDFFLYWIHRGMHTNNFLWKTHQFHHSTENLYWFSGFRTSFMHVFLFAFPQVLVGFYLFHLTPFQLGVGFALGALSQLFSHANIHIPKFLPLHHVLVTPDFHHPHHSQMGTQNKNFGSVFTIWDRLFGTYVDPSKIKQDYKYGLKEKPKTWRMMIGL
jgi:sterol desaturase/sphingolipid hydroxylase (fatty acid hydroxylase superfamily)